MFDKIISTTVYKHTDKYELRKVIFRPWGSRYEDINYQIVDRDNNVVIVCYFGGSSYRRKDEILTWLANRYCKEDICLN